MPSSLRLLVQWAKKQILPAVLVGVLTILPGYPWMRWGRFWTRPQPLVAPITNLWVGSEAIGDEVLNNIFDFADDYVTSTNPFLEKEISTAWLRHLHGFDWLLDLEMLSSEPAKQQSRRLLSIWLRQHNDWSIIAWRTPELANRLAMWLTHYDWLVSGAEQSFRDLVNSSIESQYRHLRWTWRCEARPHIRMRSLKAMLLVECALPDAQPRRINQYLRNIERLLPSLIQADGGGYYASPGEQMALFTDLADILFLSERLNLTIPESIEDKLLCLLPFLLMMQFPQGEMPAFHGMHGYIRQWNEEFHRLIPKETTTLDVLPRTGFAVLEREQTKVFIDVGSIADAQDAQSAGTLSFEFADDAAIFVVNAGTPDPDQYGSARFRHTEHHSTVTIDGVSSSSLGTRWGTGRRDQRRFARVLEQPLTQPSYAAYDDKDWLVYSATHDGYADPFGLVHQRRWQLSLQGDLLAGRDRIYPAVDAYGFFASHDDAYALECLSEDSKTSIHRHQPREVVCRFIIHPTVNVQHGGAANPRLVELTHRNGQQWQFGMRFHPVQVEPAVYNHYDGSMHDTTAIVSRVTYPRPSHPSHPSSNAPHAEQLVVGDNPSASMLTFEWAFRKM
ncbi:MAG: heparinase II/III family protein [Alphaproteobacteria bacterium]|nr:heparinase II/III family protein [Alphaproteobacteria bacterium]